MYESFYGLKDKPFSMLPDPGFLYLSKKHQAALTMLEYALYNNAGFCVISGDIGAGKTTLLRKLLENMEANVTVGMITNTHQSFGELLDWVLAAFDIHKAGLNKVEMHQVFVDFLMQQYAQDKTALLIVDEAQNIDVETLEELRMLSNINSEKDQLLQVILAGQPELKQTMRLPALKQFVQRIAVDYHLGPLNLEETFGYIQHRLITAGAKRNVFTPLACQRIYEYSGGIPRLINLLCDTVMVYGFADQVKLIGENLVDEMVRERMADSLVPLVRSAPAAADKGTASEQSKKNSAPDPESARRSVKQPAASAHLTRVSSEQKKKGATAQAEKKTAAKTLKPVAVAATRTDQQALSLNPAEEQVSQHAPEADFDIALDPEPAANTATAKDSSEATRSGPKKNKAGKIKPDELKPVFDVEANLKAEAEARRLAQAEFLPEAEATNPAPVARHVENHIEVLQPPPVSESKLFDKWTLLILALLVLVVSYLVMPDIDFESAPREVATEPARMEAPAAELNAELEAEAEKSAGLENELSESVKLKLEEAEKLKLELEQMKLDERTRLEQVEE
ncbi:MAG: AAA family ATPase, partial [Gammaproteobacteria bacterium]